MQRIASRAFGVTEKAGVLQCATLYTMRNANGVTASVTDFGATLQSLMLPDASGTMADCVLGFDDVSGYAAEGTPYFGCIVGRVANRIAKGKFSLGGTEHTLAINNPPNTLHGGPGGYSKQLWKATPIDAPGAPPAVALTLQDPDGHEGYPGNVSVSVTYTLTDDNELKIDMQATTSAPTPLNLANHTYWNLDGSGSGDILNTKVKMSVEEMTPMDDTSIPTGEIVPVAGTPFDFTAEETIGARIKDITCPSAGGGYDHNLVVKADGWGKLSHVATCTGVGGRQMTLLTNAPGVQFYTGNFLGGVDGKAGAKYEKHHGFCLETQYYPDSINQPQFPSCLLNPGEVYSHSMICKFDTA